MINTLFTAFDQARMTYCHWKSNFHLDEALAGKTDLDLLVAQADEPHFRQLLSEHGFKLIISPPAKQYPGLEDYLGFDPESTRLAHLHVHYRLVLGEQLVKNYRLPLESDFLASAQPHELGGVMTPSPEWELIILVVRVLLKTRDRDLIKAAIRRSPFPAAIQDELADLTQRIELATFAATLEAADAVIPSELVEDFLDKWRRELLTVQELWRLRYRIRQALKPYQRMGRLRATGLYFVRDAQKRLPWGGEAKKRIATGGLTIAFVGPDGAGKSTLVAKTRKWLSWKLKVRRIYMGSQEPGIRSQISRFLMRLTRLTNRLLQSAFGDQSKISQLFSPVVAFFFAWHMIDLARTRYQRYLEGKRAANQGLIVLYDRYPLAPLHAVMDGPRIRESFTYPWLRRWAEKEEQFYRAILPPDLVIALHLRPEVALARKPEENAQLVHLKSTAVAALYLKGDHDFVWVDAEQPLEMVQQQVRNAIWKAL